MNFLVNSYLVNRASLLIWKLYLSGIKRKKTEAGFTNWNVVLSGSGKLDNDKKNQWVVGGRGVGLVKRSRRGAATGKKINIGVLRTPTDLYADMTKEMYDSIPDEYKLTQAGKEERARLEDQLEEIDEKQPKKSVVNEMRKAGRYWFNTTATFISY